MSSWINTKEQLPREDGRYLASCGSVFIARYTSSNKSWKREDDREGNQQEVQYWMNIPKSPNY